MKIDIYPPLHLHEIGFRENQEDALWPKEAGVESRLFILCDGMGGHEHGEVASQTVCQSIGKWYQEHLNGEDVLSDDQLRDAIEYAYTELDKYADGSPRQMGTTLTLLYIGSKGVTAAHMGDSRIYHIRPYSPPELGGVWGGLNEGILYQSRDHSLAFDLFQAGEITYEEMATYPQRNVVTRAMTPGEDNRMRPDIIHISDIKSDDYFYMCSDGMMEKMTNDDLMSMLSADMDDKMKVGYLKMATNQSFDNHTAWLIHIKDVIKEENDDQYENEESTSRFNAINILPRPVYDAEYKDVVVVEAKVKSLFQKIIGIFK